MKKKKRKLIGFIAGEKGSIGKLQALALGIGGLMASGGFIPKIVRAWCPDCDPGSPWPDWGANWSGDAGWVTDWGVNYQDWGAGNYWGSDWGGDWHGDWGTDWGGDWFGDWVGNWGADWLDWGANWCNDWGDWAGNWYANWADHPPNVEIEVK
jgi:hypothetical protein